MVMRHIMEIALRNAGGTKHPDWVSVNNASLKAWQCVEDLKADLQKYISSHSKITHYLNKSDYQIKPSQVAKKIGINRSTLMHSSSYSIGFATYLEEVNAELEKLKTEKLDKARRSPSRGPTAESKEDLVRLNTELKRRIAELENLKTEQLVRQVLDQVPLPIKRKLGLT